MGLRFSEDGPEFPVELVDQLLAGRVVFLCGAGVSTPQLPGFGQLVEAVYADIGVAKTGAEKAAIEHDRFEEALGTLSRRLANRRGMHDTVARLLATDAPILTNHKILLRLSRSLDNRVVLVTTNFDTFFERALEEVEGHGRGRLQSLAGQALPAPGADDFFGVIHLHGRLADRIVGVDSTPLVLTSAEYGDAYMRSGWASRFLFDLVRCRALVLVGYSAGDAPVRYFLNVLESDRERFSDLQGVYALDAFDRDAAQADDRWAAVAVTPLPYRRAPEGAGDRHAALWRDLSELAALVDRPKQWRRRRATEVLSRPLGIASPAVTAEVAWLFRNKRDLWDIAIGCIADPQWFDHFSRANLWDEADAAWVLAAWCSRDWTDVARLDAAVAWHERFGRPFGQALETRLTVAPHPPSLMARAWRLLARDCRPPRDHLLQAYSVSARIRAEDWSDEDLRTAVKLLRPRVAIRAPYRQEGDPDAKRGPATRLSDLLHPYLAVEYRDGLPEVTTTLRRIPDRAARLVEIATGELRATIELAREAELIGNGWDILDAGIPTVETHPQNDYHDGAVFLANLLSDLLPVVAERDAVGARAWAEAWRDLPSRIGPRLYLQALRRDDLYSADDVAAGVLALSKEAFWAIRRELVLAMSERLGSARQDLIDAICQRVLSEAPTLFDDIGELEEGQTDWRPHARDRDAWLRLTALRRADVLPVGGAVALEAIAERHPFVVGDFGEEDLFASYSTGVHTVKGDPTPLLDVDPEERLAVAHKLSAAWDPDTQRSWSAYCSADPAGAFQALQQSQLGEADAGLWSDLISSLTWRNQPETEVQGVQRQGVIAQVFARLEEADEALLSRIGARLVDLLPTARAADLPTCDAWWDRLWETVERDDTELELESVDRFYDRVINQPAGRLAEQLLLTIDRKRRATRRVSTEDRVRLRRMLASDTKAGWFARGACVRDAGFVLQIDRSGTLQSLRPTVAADDAQGATLRSVLVEFARLGSKATRAFKKEVVRGVLDSQAANSIAAHVASRLLSPLVSQAMTNRRVNWGVNEREVREVLERARDPILEGAAECFRTWISTIKGGPEVVWRDGIRPVFEAVWPRERRFKRPALTHNLATLCVGARGAFPEAFEVVRHYLSPFDGDWVSVHFLESSTAPEQHPETSLSLLWAVCGPGSRGQSTEMGKVLDRIAAASPALEIDRRLQWLEQRAIRYE